MSLRQTSLPRQGTDDNYIQERGINSTPFILGAIILVLLLMCFVPSLLKCIIDRRKVAREKLILTRKIEEARNATISVVRK